MDKIREAFELSKKLHKNQTDKAGKDYFNAHILKVFNGVGGFDSTPEELGIVALLHDAVEDTDLKINQIYDKFGERVYDAVKALTKDKDNDEDYFEYIENIKANELAKQVKIADLKHNSDLSRLDEVSNEDYERKRKYMQALDILEGS